MKSFKKSIDLLIKLNALAFGGLCLINHHVRINSCHADLLDKSSGFTFKWNDTSIHYDVYGDQGENLLLIHDAHPSASGADLVDLAKQLSNKYTVYVIDLPGCGRSDKPNITYTNYYYVQCIHEFIKVIIQDKVKIAAVGLSGSFAATICSLYKEEISELVLIDPWNLKKLSAVPDEKSFIVRCLLSLPVIGESIYNILYTKKQIDAYLSDHQFFNPFSITNSTVNKKYEAAHLGNGNGRFLLASIDGRYINWNINRIISALTTPTTILYGEKSKDGALTAKQYRELKQDITLVAIKKADHALCMENTEDVAAVL